MSQKNNTKSDKNQTGPDRKTRPDQTGLKKRNDTFCGQVEGDNSPKQQTKIHILVPAKASDQWCSNTKPRRSWEDY